SFFFSSRRRHTRFSRDWSSDVCSSDLQHHAVGLGLSVFKGVGKFQFDVTQLFGCAALARQLQHRLAVVQRQHPAEATGQLGQKRSEERRVGKERRTQGGERQDREDVGE